MLAGEALAIVPVEKREKVREAARLLEQLLLQDVEETTGADGQPKARVREGTAPGGLQLYGWTAIDPQGHRTTVKLSDVRYNVAVPESAFTYAEPKKRRG